MTVSESAPAVTHSIQSGIPNYGRTIRDLLRDPHISDRGKVVYALLDDYASGERKPFPSRATLAGSLGCSLNSIDRALRELADAGWITKQTRRRPDGGCTSNEYTLSVSTPLPNSGEAPSPPVRPQEEEPLKKDFLSDRGSDESEKKKPKPKAQSTEAARKQREADSDFMAFYNLYPRHEAVADCYKAWKATEENPACIMFGLSAQIETLRQQAVPDESGKVYCPLPATWLRKERWNDEVTPRQQHVVPDRKTDYYAWRERQDWETQDQWMMRVYG